MRIIGLMVVLDERDPRLPVEYVPVEFIFDTDFVPKNNPKDIAAMVGLCNSKKHADDKFTYIDVFGIVKDGVTERWEEEPEGEKDDNNNSCITNSVST